MTPAHVVFRLPDNRCVPVPVGGFIGRVSTAHLRLRDPEVSEGHAMISLRGREIRILALRGPVVVNDTPVAEAALRVRQKIRLSPTTVLIVEDVVLPESVLAIEGLQGGPVELAESAASLLSAPARIEPGLHRDAWAWIWNEGDAWFVQETGGVPTLLEVGRALERGDDRLRVISVPLGRGPNDTKAEDGAPVRVEIGPGFARMGAGRGPMLSLGGNQADLIRLLAEADAPVHWTRLAKYFWPEKDQPKWRDRFDAMVKELKAKLRDHRIRPDVVWSWDGSYKLNLTGLDTLVETGDGAVRRM